MRSRNGRGAGSTGQGRGTGTLSWELGLDTKRTSSISRHLARSSARLRLGLSDPKSLVADYSLNFEPRLHRSGDEYLGFNWLRLLTKLFTAHIEALM